MGAGRRDYTIIKSEANGSDRDIYLDRPLDIALADDDLAFPGPAGSMNWAMHRNCLALVTRPLAAPQEGTGAMAAVLSHNDVGMRVVMQYDSSLQGTRVNMDILAGVALLDANLCVTLLG